MHYCFSANFEYTIFGTFFTLQRELSVLSAEFTVSIGSQSNKRVEEATQTIESRLGDSNTAPLS